MEFLDGKFGRKEGDQKCATLMPPDSLNRRQKCAKYEEANVKMQKCKYAKLRKSKNTKFKNWLSPVSPGDDSGELVAAHEWTWQVGFNKNNPQFKKTHFPFFCLYLTTQFRQICLQG